MKHSTPKFAHFSFITFHQQLTKIPQIPQSFQKFKSDDIVSPLLIFEYKTQN
jgi:hypothetical protein